jgi:O-acetyl-ADP-ribose deacetylase (regulator of RNase III)
MATTYRIGKTTIKIVQGDITDQTTEAIVNAANSTLMGGGGVDGAIHRRGGPRILEECKRIRATQWPQGLPTGKAVITTGGNLRAKYVIHTVGPIWHGGGSGEQGLLRNCYMNSLKLAVEKGIKSIAFPSISTGAYGYPIGEAAEVALAAVKEFLESSDALEEAVFVLFSQSDFNLYLNIAKEFFGTR